MSDQTFGTFRKKPIVIEAVQFTRRFAWPDWFHDAVSTKTITTHGTGKFADPGEHCFCEIHTLEGDMRGDEGDWIIKGVKGEIYPCKPDIFAMTYEVATPAPAQPEADVCKAFEAWAVRNWFAIHRNGNAQFVNTATQHAWNGWKGASEAGAAAPVLWGGRPYIVRLAEDFADACVRKGYVSTSDPTHARLMEAAGAAAPAEEAAPECPWKDCPHGSDCVHAAPKEKP